MYQRIYRVKHYGMLSDGDVLAMDINGYWYVAKMKNRDTAYIIVALEDGSTYTDYTIPKFVEYYFPKQTEITFIELLFDKHIKNTEKVNKELKKYRLWKTFSSTWATTKEKLSSLLPTHRTR